MNEYNWNSIFAIHEYFLKAQISVDRLNEIWSSDYDPFYRGPVTCFDLYKRITGHPFDKNNLFAELFPIKSFAEIKYLFLSELGITDITPIKKLHHLEAIVCSGNPINALDPLQDLKLLKELNFDKNNIGAIDALSDLSNLEVLELMDNQITNVDPLARLVNLKKLGLAGNRIQDVTPLSNLTALISLDISYNEITNIAELKNLRNLKVLRLPGNDIEINEIIELGRYLRTCSIYFNSDKLKSQYNANNGNLYFENVGDYDVPLFVNLANSQNSAHVSAALLDKNFKPELGTGAMLKNFCRKIADSTNRENHVIRYLKQEQFLEETSDYVRAQFDYQ